MLLLRLLNITIVTILTIPLFCCWWCPRALSSPGARFFLLSLRRSVFFLAVVAGARFFFCCRRGGAFSFFCCRCGGAFFFLLSSLGARFFLLSSLGARYFFFAVVAGARFFLAVVAGARFFSFAVVAGARFFFAVVAGARFFLLSLQEPGLTHSLASWVRATTTKTNIKQLQPKKTRVPTHTPCHHLLSKLQLQTLVVCHLKSCTSLATSSSLAGCCWAASCACT